jgi:hypothetical protein
MFNFIGSQGRLRYPALTKCLTAAFNKFHTEAEQHGNTLMSPTEAPL